MADGLHWYDPVTGKSRHTIQKSTGDGERSVTLRDARKYALVPSVTNIIGILDKPFLLVWKEQQILAACSDWPYQNGDDIDEWKAQCLNMSRQITYKAAEKGRIVHNALEDYYRNGVVTEENADYVNPVKNLLLEKFGDVEWIAEESFAKNGYGGTCDLYSREANIILDFKTKNKEDLKKLKPYREHAMQLAAYRLGLDLPTARCYNLFISTCNMGEMLLHEWKEEEISKSEKMFDCLKQFWYLNSGL